jgi:hypothetical protein
MTVGGYELLPIAEKLEFHRFAGRLPGSRRPAPGRRRATYRRASTEPKSRRAEEPNEHRRIAAAQLSQAPRIMQADQQYQALGYIQPMFACCR